MSFLDQAVDLLPLATATPLTDEDRNLATIPAGPPATVRHGMLVHADAGPPGGEGPPQRVVAVLGPAATFAGIADTLAPLYATAASAGGPAVPTPDDLARALVVYAKDYLAAAANWQFHTVGVILPLPVEIDPGSGAWIVDADGIRTLAQSFDAAWRSRLRTSPDALAVPDALDLETEAATLVSTLSTAPAVATQLWPQALRNPSGTVLQFFAALRALDQATAGQAAAAAVAALTTATPDQLSVLAATSAGNAILRRFSALLTPLPDGADPALATRLDDALHQGTGTDRTLVAHRDVPETAAQQALRPGTAKPVEGAPADPPGGVHRLVLGHDVAVGLPASDQVDGMSFTGQEFDGRVALRAYLTADAAELNPMMDPTTTAFLTLLANDADPGSQDQVQRLDSFAATDANLLTAGLDQWSATADTGLPGLLFAFKTAAPDEFDLFFALHGLDVQQGPAGGPQHQFLLLGQDGTGTVPSEDALRAFFGGTAAADGAVTFGSDWAARFRLPAIVSARQRRVQVAQAAPRAAAVADPFELKAAQFGPFPTAYSMKFSTSTRLDDNVKTQMTGGGEGQNRANPDPNSVIGKARHDGASSADTLAVAVVDLTGNLPNPRFGGLDESQTFYVGSMAKIGPMYAAFELRYRLRQLIAAVKAAGLDTTHKDWLPRTRKAIEKVWGPQICRGLPGLDSLHLNTRFRAMFPDLDTIFTFAADGTVDFATTGVAGDIKVGVAELDGPMPPDTKFFDWMTAMILWSNGHGAAKVIDSIKFPYINHVLREGGFFDPTNNLGIWVSQDYDILSWKAGVDLMHLSPLGVLHYKATTNLMATGRDVATLLTLAAMGLLFGGKAETSSAELVTLMRKTFPADTAPANPAGPGLGEPFAGAVGLHAGDSVSSKVGINDALPPNPFHGMSDCVIIERAKSPETKLRYVAVILGGWEDDNLNRPVWDNAARALDASISALH